MGLDLQKPGLWKRIAAWMFDVILLAVLAVGFAMLLSLILGYDGYAKEVDEAYAHYEAQYGVKFDITEEEYEALTEEQRQNYKDAAEALNRDEEAVRAYNMMFSLTLIMVTVGILLSYLALEVLVPVLFRNGQTLGKKCFGIGLMRVDGVKLTTLQLFVRAILGKFTLETMIPVYIVLMIFFNQMGLMGTSFLAVFALIQAILLFSTKNNTVIHDKLAGTVAVDISSQMIFETTQDLLEYKQKLHAEQAAKQEY